MTEPTTLSLQDAIGFTNADLDANRAGRMSEAQKQRLTKMWRRTLTITIVAVIIIGLVATVFLFFGQENDSIVLNVIGMGLTVVNAVIVGVGARTYLRIQRDSREEMVEVLEGELRHTIQLNTRNRRARTYILDIGSERLIVTRDIFNAFEERVPYRLYRAPTTKMLFSAEKA